MRRSSQLLLLSVCLTDPTSVIVFPGFPPQLAPITAHLCPTFLTRLQFPPHLLCPSSAQTTAPFLGARKLRRLLWGLKCRLNQRATFSHAHFPPRNVSPIPRVQSRRSLKGPMFRKKKETEEEWVTRQLEVVLREEKRPDRKFRDGTPLLHSILAHYAFLLHKGYIPNQVLPCPSSPAAKASSHLAVGGRSW